jgi:SAM-dependent methyltransferase
MTLPDEPDDTKINFVRCNANDMRDVFADGQFGTVLCNAMIEHDKYFWRSLDEMKRVLAPGGILAIGAPGYVPRKQLSDDLTNDTLDKATVTLDVHSAPDYWRFSRMAYKEVICEGLELLDLSVVLRIPILVAVARKPMDGLLQSVAQQDRARLLREENEMRRQHRQIKLLARADEEAAIDISALTPAELAAREARLQRRAARLQEREAKRQEREARQKQRAAKIAVDAM